LKISIANKPDYESKNNFLQAKFVRITLFFLYLKFTFTIGAYREQLLFLKLEINLNVHCNIKW